MINISDSTIVIGSENVRSVRHLESCLNNRTKCDKPKYTYFGKIASRGTVIVHTSDGPVKVTFSEKNGWAKKLTIEKML